MTKKELVQNSFKYSFINGPTGRGYFRNVLCACRCGPSTVLSDFLTTSDRYGRECFLRIYFALKYVSRTCCSPATSTIMSLLDMAIWGTAKCQIGLVVAQCPRMPHLKADINKLCAMVEVKKLTSP
jgi:hypothetical protein